MRIKILSVLAAMLAFSSLCFAQQRVSGRITVTGAASCATAGSCVQLPLGQGAGSVGINITGTYTGTLSFEATADGSNYAAAPFCFDSTGASAQSTTTTGLFVCSASGFSGFQVRASAAVTGSAVVTLQVGSGAIGAGGAGATIDTTGLATDANQSLMIDGLTNIDANTTAIASNTATIASLLNTPTGPQTPDNANALTILGAVQWQANITSKTNDTITVAIVAGTASNYTYVRGCQFSNYHASADSQVFLVDASTGNTIWGGIVPHTLGNNPHFDLEAPLQVPTLGAGLSAKAESAINWTVSCQGFTTTVDIN